MTVTHPDGTPLKKIAAKQSTSTSDTTPKVIHALPKKIKGTVYWGGAGLDGDYINDQIKALTEIGIEKVIRGHGSDGTILDAFKSGTSLRYKSDTAFKFSDESELKKSTTQFNLIGYSYGSLLAAQHANYYANHDVRVDNLVLVASPISSEFLNGLIMMKNIGSVQHININQFGDPLYAGMPEIELLGCAPLLVEQMAETQIKGEGVGHFFFAMATKEGARRRRALAKAIQKMGLK